MNVKKTTVKKKKIIRFGVLGVGGMGRHYCQVLGNISRASLAAVCDANIQASKDAGKQYNVPSFFNHRDLIRSGCCDAVAVVTPHPFHAQIAIDCMRAGLHVITEKPLSERVATADKMIKTARECRVAFAVMFQRRLEPVFRKAIEIVQSGQLGRIYRTALFVHEYRSQRYYDSGTWRATWQGEGGGVLINQAPHVIDMFVQLAGTPGEIFGRTETRMHRIEVEDHAEALLKYKNGASGYIYCSTNEPAPGNMMEFFGDKGKLVLRDNKLIFYRFSVPISKHLREYDQMWGAPDATEALSISADKSGGSKSGHQLVLENMVRHLLEGEPLVTPGESGLGSLELANAITLSSYEGKWVKLPLDRRRYDQLLARLQRESKFVKNNVKAELKTDPRLEKTRIRKSDVIKP